MKIAIEVELLDSNPTGLVCIKAFNGKIQIISQGLADTMKIALVAVDMELSKKFIGHKTGRESCNKKEEDYVNNTAPNLHP